MKHEFPIAKIREDKTPAIWFTHDYWLILEGGIARAYLDNRRHGGETKARNEQRQALGKNHGNARLKDWEFLDSWPQEKTNAAHALALFKVGYEAYKHIGDRNAPTLSHWTPEKLVAHGDREERRAYDEELKLIKAAQPKENHDCTN